MSIEIQCNEAIFAFTDGQTFSEYAHRFEPEQRLALTRRYDAVRVPVDAQSTLATYPVWLYWVLLVSDDTPDTLMVLPIVQRMAELSPRIDLRVLSDEADLSALNELVDDEIDLDEALADIDLPRLFIFDEEWNQQAQWGPRPEAAEARLDEWLTSNPDYEQLLAEDETDDSARLDQLISDLTAQMRLWYNHDLTSACIAEIMALLDELNSDDSE
ncbi:MAG: thioredoxin family protein [Caldilineaceae bacterium]